MSNNFGLGEDAATADSGASVASSVTNGSGASGVVSVPDIETPTESGNANAFAAGGTGTAGTASRTGTGTAGTASRTGTAGTVSRTGTTAGTARAAAFAAAAKATAAKTTANPNANPGAPSASGGAPTTGGTAGAGAGKTAGAGAGAGKTAANPNLNASTAAILAALGLAPSASKTAVPTPTVPIMGGIAYSGGYPVPWTGGKPKSDWSGLDSSNFDQKNPNLLRNSGEKSSYNYNARRNGLYTDEPTSKYKKGDDLDYFITKVRAALLDHGLDTICYRKDPVDLTTVIDTLEAYARLNNDVMSKQSSWFQQQFDSYDKKNDESAKLFLLNSLEDTLKKRIETKIQDSMTFVDVFFVFLKNQRHQNTDMFGAVIKQVLEVRVSDFPGHNITLYCDKVRPLITYLEKARAWDSNKNVDLCQTLMDAGGKTNFEYQLPMTTKMETIMDAALNCNHLANAQKLIHMSSLDVGWNDILDLAEEKYLMQMTPGSIRWAPACHSRDSKAPPSQFSVNLSQAPSYRSFQGTCHHCGKKGHMKRDCHQLKNSGNSGNSGRS